jgi:hypothetical protein
MGARKWVRSRVRQRSQRLADLGPAASAPTVGRLLKAPNDALRVNAKAKEAGSQHPERDAQFQYSAAQKEAFTAADGPIISVDTTQKALIGTFQNAGPLWGQHPIEVNGHDVPGDALGRAVPYGLDDLQQNEGAVSVGMSADTPEFAVTAIGPWWEDRGPVVYPQGTALLILADGGGSTGCRSRVWTAPLPSQLSDRLGLRVTVCHDPTGCSTWNPLEHRWFSPSSLNGAGQPWRTVETMLDYLRNTTTTTRLRVTARRLAGVYQTGTRVADAVMNTRQVEHHAVCPQWNYTIHPRWDDAPAP